MQLDDAVGEIGTLTVLALAHGLTDRRFVEQLGHDLPVPLPVSGADLGSRASSMVVELVADVLPGFRRLVIAGPELLVVDALAAAGCTTPITVALPPWTTPGARERIEANLPRALDISLVCVPHYPDGKVSASDTLMLICGFDAGPAMWSVAVGSRAVLDFYRSQFLYQVLLMDPLGIAVHHRARLFTVISGVVIDRAIRYPADTMEVSSR